jgi:hypothetical protein
VIGGLIFIGAWKLERIGGEVHAGGGIEYSQQQNLMDLYAATAAKTSSLKIAVVLVVVLRCYLH